MVTTVMIQHDIFESQLTVRPKSSQGKKFRLYEMMDV